MDRFPKVDFENSQGRVRGSKTDRQTEVCSEFRNEIKKQVQGTWSSGQAFGGVEVPSVPPSGVRKILLRVKHRVQEKERDCRR